MEDRRKKKAVSLQPGIMQLTIAQYNYKADDFLS